MPTDDETRLRRLLRGLWTATARRPRRPDGGHVAPPDVGVDLLPFDAGSAARTGRDLPVVAHLPAALAATRAAGFETIADDVAALGPALPWTQTPSYTEANVGAHFMANYAYGLLSGPEGPLACESPYAGLILLLGPGLHYRDHRHSPREVYLLLTPGAEWRLDGGDWFPVAAGEVVFHRAWQPHATRVGEVPLLAFVAWLDPADRGGIDI